MPPFDSYLVPGLLLLLLIGGVHLAAFILQLRRQRFAQAAAGVAGIGLLIWIFVQMVYIPFSSLQALYFGFGLLELGLLLMLLNVLGASSK